MNKMKIIGAGCLLLLITTSSFADGLSLVAAQIAQAYNVDAQNKSYQRELQRHDQLEKEQIEIRRQIAQADAAQKLQYGHDSMSVHDDSDYRVLPSRCMKEATTEFMCYAGNDNYYKVIKLVDGYSWKGSNTTKNMNWNGQLSQQGERTVYSGTDANGKAFRKNCGVSTCFE